MRRILHSFADEFLKIAAFPQQSGSGQAYDASTARIMDQSQGTNMKSGLKTGQPVASATAPKTVSPTPLTTPNSMVDVASKSGGS